ncbi:RHS repeat-associated core domain-containing protein [Akkermansia sp. BIOML-A44]|uniref:RHS repeat domain-containing protein n=1 Tax=Akkermansia sp. BIOML-A44 TaxID=2584600 RepID=UPI00122EB068|nr:RHS repeat-associated core domain-containing protein [Akkermansia sp. BIOML-A44]KAA3206942.1 RHS repeat-associated core domain-containing protein [Akkermansia sp. BIOML-A44]
MVPTVTVYDELGKVVRQTILLDELHPEDTNKNRIAESSTCYQTREDGIYKIQTSTTYNTEGLPVTQTAETMVSQLDPVLESKVLSTDIYGQQSIQWSEYTAPARRTQFSRIPTSDITAISLVVDGFTINQNDHAGIHSSQERSYTSTGMILKQTDGRGNVTTTESDLAGRTVKTMDAEGNMTSIAYSTYCDSPSCVTDAMGGTICYSYDIRGRKAAEYGTAIQPACFSYDEADRIIALTTFRANEGDITVDPSGRTDGDTTTWLYDATTGLELKKTYADGSCTVKTYDKLNRLETLTRARGIVTTYQYAPATGELVSVSHSDDTQPWFYAYNHLGQMISVCDASGTRELSYDAYGKMIQDTSFGQVESSIQKDYDAFGRPAGYRLMLGSRTIQHSHLDYGHQGAMIGMNLEGLASPFTWEYDETSGFLNQLSYPNGMVRSNTYHPKLNLLASIGYEDAGTRDMLAGHVYQYDHLMRPVQRKDSWEAATPATTRDFTYNNRSELVEDRIGQDGSFSYQYDNIGNRKSARELEEEVSYEANQLNQYTDVTGETELFTPSFDPDGNQTTIKTSTGIWEVSYDANNRPVSFTSEDGRITVTCGYDYQGRRFEKKVAVSGAITSHAHYLYRGYLQVAELNMMHPMPVLEKSYLWNPAEAAATRILMMTCWKENGMADGEHLFFTHDALKNVTSIFDDRQTRRARYEYAPFGALITAQGDMAQDNRFRFSCEFMDDELGLVYYNYRHLNPLDGRWISRDPIAENGGENLYGFVSNSPYVYNDYQGLWLSRRHRRLTRRPLSTYKFILTVKEKEISLTIKEKLLEVIVEANVDTDSGEMGKTQAYHYCTGLDSKETHQEARDNYIAMLLAESKKFDKKISKEKVSSDECKEALEILGHLNHMWQDYYAHKVELDENKKSVVGKIQGSPDDPQMFPVSFGSMGFKGGHGGFWRIINPFSRVEPGDRADDVDIRRQQAKEYTKTHSDLFLKSWFKKCKCHFYRKEINKHGGNCQ